MNRRLRRLISAGFLVISFSGSAAHSGEFFRTDNAIPGSYIVVLKDSTEKQKSFSTSAVAASQLASKYSVESEYVYEHAISGFSVKATEDQAKRMAQDPSVAYVVEDGKVSINATQMGAPWGLDRIDQRSNSLNKSYIYNQTGAGVHVYVLDTGIRSTHTQFNNRVDLDFTSINDGNGPSDCNGHGTHVAGIIGGSKYGVAKDVRLHSVRVLPCDGDGPTSRVIAGVDWVTANARKPAVANMSLSGDANRALDDAVRRSIRSGITYVLAAGNKYSRNSCTYSPARTRAAITVGATRSNDSKADYSNIGTCIDMFAPGSGITSSWWTSDTATLTINGTSMAAPHVAGTAALYLQNHQNASPEEVSNTLQRMASFNKLSGLGSGSPNIMLYSRHSTLRRYPFFRYFNTSNSDHFYTTTWSELGAGGFSSWHYEGVQGYLSPTHKANTTKLFRYLNTKNGDHFYTTNWSELGAGGGNWNYEGVAGYVPTVAASDTAELYRYVNTISGDHFYTTNWSELGAGGGSWVYEGVQCLIYTTP
jgi:subtilisin family serine protease